MGIAAPVSPRKRVRAVVRWVRVVRGSRGGVAVEGFVGLGGEGGRERWR